MRVNACYYLLSGFMYGIVVEFRRIIFKIGLEPSNIDLTAFQCIAQNPKYRNW